MDNEYYKYVSFETAKIILSDLTIRFSKPCSFNDIYDCEAPYKVTNFSKKDFLALHDNALLLCNEDAKNKLKIEYSKILSHEYSDEIIKHAAKTIIDNCRNTINDNQRVLCLSKNKDSILMWSHYAQNHTGVVIGFDKNYRFMKNACEIQYSENPQNIEGRILKDLCTNNDQVKNEYVALFLTKYIDWQYENEVRCFFSVKKLTNYFNDINIENNNSSSKNCSKQLNSKADSIDLPIFKEAIKSIYLGAKTKDNDKQEVITLTKNISNSIKIFQAKKASDSYKLYFEELF